MSSASLRLAREGLIVGEEKIFDVLLRDRARALLDAPVLNVDERRARHARRVEAHVRVKAAILHRDDRTPEVGRDAVDGNVVRTVQTSFDRAADEQHAHDALPGIRLIDLVKLVCGLLPFGIRQQQTDALPSAREEEERAGAEDEYEEDEDQTQQSRAFLGCAFPPRGAFLCAFCPFCSRTLSTPPLRRRLLILLFCHGDSRSLCP